MVFPVRYTLNVLNRRLPDAPVGFIDKSGGGREAYGKRGVSAEGCIPLHPGSQQNMLSSVTELRGALLSGVGISLRQTSGFAARRLFCSYAVLRGRKDIFMRKFFSIPGSRTMFALFLVLAVTLMTMGITVLAEGEPAADAAVEEAAANCPTQAIEVE